MSVVEMKAFATNPQPSHALTALKAGVGYAYLGRRLRYAQPFPQAKMLLAYSQRILRFCVYPSGGRGRPLFVLKFQKIYKKKRMPCHNVLN